MTNTVFSGIADFRDIESLNHYAEAVAAGIPVDQVLTALRSNSRDNGRTPMQWDDSPNAGFGTFGAGLVQAEVAQAPSWTVAELVIGNYPVDTGAELVPRPWEARVYRRDEIG